MGSTSFVSRKDLRNTLTRYNELFIGFRGLRDVTEALATLGIIEVEFESLKDNDEEGSITARLANLADEESEDNWIRWDLFDLVQDQVSWSKVSTAVARTYRKALEAAGFEILPVESPDMIFVPAETPLGYREFSAWKIELFQDPETEDLFLGISLSGRYNPTFCDWKNEHGGLNPIVFNDELRGMVEIAEGLLTTAWPHLENANLMVVSREC